MEKKSNPTETLSRQTKKVPPQPKGKVNKTKTIAVRSKIKGGNVKRVKKATVGKQKTNPAPISEVGFSLYSSTSDDSIVKEQDTCSRVLTLLKERHKYKGSDDIRTAVQDLGCDTTLSDVDIPMRNHTYNKHGTTSSGSCSYSHPSPINIPSATNDPQTKDSATPFNNRLLSSTPDPECLVYDTQTPNQFQLIPERDTSTLWHHVMRSSLTNNQQSGYTVNQQNFPVANPIASFGNVNFPGPGAFQTIIPGSVAETNTIPSAYSVPLHSELFDSHRTQHAVIQTQSLGFLPSQNPYLEAQISEEIIRRDSDINMPQSFIPRESAGFVPQMFPMGDGGSKSKSSSSSGDKDKTSSTPGFFSTPDTTSTGYVTLPKPKGTVQQGKIEQGTVPVLTQHNGLYQLHPLAQQQNPIMEQYVTGQARYPSPVPNFVAQNFEGSYLCGKNFEIPEKDEAGIGDSMAIPIMKLPDAMSSISGTPSSQRTVTVSSLTPQSEATPRNSSSSSGAKSVHFENIDQEGHLSDPNTSQKNDLSPKSKSSQTQTEVCNLQMEHLPGATLEHTAQGTSIDRNPVLCQANVYQNANSEVSGIQQLLHHPWLSQEQISGQSHMSTPSSVAMTTNMNITPSPASNVSSGIHSGSKDHSSGIASSVCSDVPNPWSQVKTDAGLKKLRYYLKELNECGKMRKKSEIGRLVKGIEKTLETIPQLKSTFSLQAEIDLALQPLRSENAQLRRKVRLLTQHAKETELTKEKAKSTSSVDFEVVQLQTSNNMLQKQIAEEKESKVKLAGEITELLSHMQKMKTEKNKLLASLSEKETDELQIRQECLADTQKLRQDMETLRRQIQGSQVRHDSLEQENHILQITLQQRDAEMRRQQEIVDTIKESVSELLQELETSRMDGEKSYMSTNSFSLQKLMQILGDDVGNSNERTIRSDPGLKSPPKHPPVKPRLTVEALATHNEIQKSQGVNREEYRGSTSDTEVELNMMDRDDMVRKKSPKPRRRSISTDGQNIQDIRKYASGNRFLLGQQRKYSEFRDEVSSRPVYNGGQILSKKNDIFNDLHATADNRIPENCVFTGNRIRVKDDYNIGNEYIQDGKSDVDFSKFSTAGSRYSVTDYFKKYPQHKPSDSFQNDQQAKLSDKIHGYQQLQLSDRSFNTDRKPKPHRRSLSQPESHQFDSPRQPMYTPNKQPVKYGAVSNSRSQVTSPQEKLFRGTQLDNSISAIDEDNISSVSEQTKSTTSTVDDKTFRKGIATLDANILKLQLALHKTKSMLS